MSMDLPRPGAVLELFKPVTWFPPMWAFGCGVVSTGLGEGTPWGLVGLGVVVAGPLVCASSQAVNDWYDRDVDAVNEPYRPIPSGRIPGRWGLYLAILWTLVSLAAGAFLGPWGFGATAVGLVLAWAYSAPPVRLKRNGWWGNAAVGFSYEGLAWVTGAAVASGGGFPGWPSLILAVVYSAGAHGIMTLNDFKSVEGDRRLGIGSLPVRLGEGGAARVAVWTMAGAQLAVIGLLVGWGRPIHAAAVASLLAIQVPMMVRFLAHPRKRALWYSGFGVPLYVLGMMASAIAVRGMGMV